MSNSSLLDPFVASAFYGKFTVLRPMQEATIRPLIAGENILLSAGTGSGKTEAVLVPILSSYWKHAIKNDELVLLYIAPTKALVNDLEKRLQSPLEKIGMRLGIRHGDRDDLIRLQKPHFLITTPESLDVLLVRKDAVLQSVRAVIIDEVHLLYNTQRGLQLSILLQRLRQITNNSFQWAALSATAGEHSDIRDFLFGPEEKVVSLQYPAERQIDAHVRLIRKESDLQKLVKKLIQGYSAKLLIFTDSRRECERFAGILNSDEKIKSYVFCHYSSLSPEMRLETEKKFSISRTGICIATSTLELGIDIGDIDAVILWGVPPGVESFLQRIGRGNRRQQKTNAICLIPDTAKAPMADALRFLALIDAAKKGELPFIAPYELFGAAGQQCLSVIASEGGKFTRIADLCEFFRHKPNLSRVQIEKILSELTKRNYLTPHGFKNRYGAGEKLYDLIDYRMIYGNFSAGSQMVEIRHESRVLGEVPAVNLLEIKRGMHVRFAGKIWVVRKIALEGFYVEPSQSKTGVMDFYYPGGRKGFDAFLSNCVWKIIHDDKISLEVFESTLLDLISNVIFRIRNSCNFNQIPCFRNNFETYYFTFGGSYINKASALITKQYEYQADDLFLSVPSKIEWSSLPSVPEAYESVFHQLFEITGDQSIYQSILPIEHQVKEYIQKWLKDKTIPLVLDRLTHSEVVNVDSDVFAPLSGAS